MKTVRIGNGAGFWGDSLDAPRVLCASAALDYLTLEYLAELTLSILAHQQARDPHAGYVTDFPIVLKSLLPSLKAQPNLRIVSNAGGLNPADCARAASQLLSASGMSDTAVAAVGGDDLRSSFDEHCAAGETFANFETGKRIDAVRDGIVSANAYLGAGGIVDALARGARIVVTGRVADASLTLGPAIHEFGWAWDDWDLLASATVAGHLIECGAQMTGGMYSDWTPGITLGDVGYPIAEISADGSLVVTKPERSGGRVSIGTVSEQLVYEIGDPAHYLTPDVDADFSHVRLEEIGRDRVRVSDARGNPAPSRYKVSITYEDGYMVAGTLVVCGRNCRETALACAETMFSRVRRAGFTVAHTNVECLGGGDSLPGIRPRPENPPEVVLRIAARDPRKEALECLAREFAPLVTSGEPGVTGYTGGRAKPHRVLAYWPSTIARTRLSPQVDVRPAREWCA